MYVSRGHRMSLDNACAQVQRLAPELRLPEPIRLADRLSHTYRRGRVPHPVFLGELPAAVDDADGGGEALAEAGMLAPHRPDTTGECAVVDLEDAPAVG